MGTGPGVSEQRTPNCTWRLSACLVAIGKPTPRVAALEPPAEHSFASRSGDARARGLKPLGPVGAVGAALLAYENTTMVAKPM